MPSTRPAACKAWGLLTYLVRSRVPPSRERLAGLLCPEADDPLRALRWTLSVLRTQLGADAELGGDPVRLTLLPGTFVDLDVLSRGSWTEAIALPGLGHELLDGLAFRSSPGFEMWLEAERRHVRGDDERASSTRPRSRCSPAARAPTPCVTRPRSSASTPSRRTRTCCSSGACARAGDAAAATRQVAACTELFRRELGIAPTPALRMANAAPQAAVHDPRLRPARPSWRSSRPARPRSPPAPSRAALQRQRAAVAAARGAGDRELLATALVALGGALVHSARGTDEEGAAALHEGTVLAEQVERHEIAATGWREISWVRFLRAQYDRAEESLANSSEFAAGDDVELAWVELIRGACRHDVGDYAGAGDLLRSALDRATRLGTPSRSARPSRCWDGSTSSAASSTTRAAILDRALEEVETRGMTAFRPWPESFRGELDLMVGDMAAAEARFEHAFALGCQVGDPCWESISLRGLGLVAAARGDIARALELLVDAPKLCRRLPDTYQWIEAYALDALCAVAVEHHAEATMQWIDELEAIAARRGIRELLLRATVYRARLGEPGAIEAARALAAQIDNPALAELLAFAEPGATGERPGIGPSAAAAR